MMSFVIVHLSVSLRLYCWEQSCRAVLNAIDDSWLGAGWICRRNDVFVRLCNTFFVHFQELGVRVRSPGEVRERKSSRWYKDWRVNKSEQRRSAAVVHTKTRVLHVGKVNYNVSRRVFYSPFSRRNSMRIALLFWTTLPFPSVSILLLLAQVSGFLHWRFDDDSSPNLGLDLPFFSDGLTSAL